MRHKLFRRRKRVRKPRFRFIRKFFRKTFRGSYATYLFAREKTGESIRRELLVVFAICFLVAIFSGTISYNFFRRFSVQASVSYEEGIKNIDRDADNIVQRLTQPDISIKETDDIENIIQGYTSVLNKILISDLDGKVLYKSNNASEQKVDIYSIIKNSMSSRENYNGDNLQIKEYTAFYPITFSDGRAYLIYSAIPEGRVEYVYSDDMPRFMLFLTALIVFIVSFIFITRRKMAYIEEISQGLIEISSGNLDFKVSRKGNDQLALLSDNINDMSSKLSRKIEEERRAEETKNQLITNVSHDLRTPLTSIMGYLGLIKEKRYESEEQLNDYVNIAFNKSEKLKVLIQDLFEYTKMANKVIEFQKTEIIINELLMQLTEEFVPVFQENNLTLKTDILKEKITLNLDGNKTVRALENLLMNSVKYSFKETIVNLKLYKDENKVIMCIHNKGENIPKGDLEYLFERFYRVDKSRTGDSSGSGLGLAIAKNIIENQNGKIWADCEENDIYFYVAFDINSY